MNKSIQMVVVLTVISLLSGLALGGLHQLTHELAENNILRFKKIPAVADIYEVVAGKQPPAERAAIEEGLLAEKRYVELDGEQKLFFVVREDGEPYAVALEDYGQGFGGELGVMIGFELATGNLIGIGITTMSETPGVGTKVRDASFLKQFQGLAGGSTFKVKKDGGDIDAVTGATVSSRAVAQAIERAAAFYAKHRAEIVAAIDSGTGGGE